MARIAVVLLLVLAACPLRAQSGPPGTWRSSPNPSALPAGGSADEGAPTAGRSILVRPAPVYRGAVVSLGSPFPSEAPPRRSEIPSEASGPGYARAALTGAGIGAAIGGVTLGAVAVVVCSEEPPDGVSRAGCAGFGAAVGVVVGAGVGALVGLIVAGVAT